MYMMHDAVIQSAPSDGVCSCALLTHSWRQLAVRNVFSCAFSCPLFCQWKSTRVSTATCCVFFLKGLQWMCATHVCNQANDKMKYVYIRRIYNIWCSIVSPVTSNTWQPPFHCIIGPIRIYFFYFFRLFECWDQHHHAVWSGMRSDDCTFRMRWMICTLVKFVWSRAHVVLCQCLSLPRHLLAGQLKQTPFFPKMAFCTCPPHPPCVVTHSLPVTVTQWTSVFVSVPNNERVRFSHEVFVVGIYVNAWFI